MRATIHALVSHMVSVNILLIGGVSQYRGRKHDFLYICTNGALFCQIVQKNMEKNTKNLHPAPI